MAAFLYPWLTVLGMEMKYRGGCSLGIDREGAVADAPELHQWLEVTLRPSMQSYVCDLYRADGTSQETWLRWPVCDAYQHWLYPHGELKLLSGHIVGVSDISDSCDTNM
jgi:hypothetical protein